MRVYKCVRRFLLRKETTEYFWRLREKVRGGHGRIVRVWYGWQYSRLMRRLGCSIPPGTEIAGCPVFPHGLSGVFLSQGAQIGRNVTLFQQVTIGSNSLADSKGRGAPLIGDNVYIGAGAKIIGGVTVGDNVRIGANAVVVTDVPEGSTVVPAPVRVIPHSSMRDNTFVPYE